MALILYDNAESSNALKVRFLLAELGLAYERRHVPFERPRPEWLTSFHPLGTIPALDDGVVRIGESNAILRYLAHRERRYDLYPLEPAERAPVEWALDTWSTQVRPALLPLELAALIRPRREGIEADPNAVAAALGPAEAALDVFELFVADNGGILGSFTIADCAAAPALWRTYRLSLPFDRWPKLARLRDAVTSRPAFQEAGPVV